MKIGRVYQLIDRTNNNFYIGSTVEKLSIRLSKHKSDYRRYNKNKTHFKYYGRDIETLFAKTKIAHSRRVFCLDPSVKKLLTIKDIDKGLEIYLKNEFSDDKDKELNKIIHSMYV